MWETFNTSDRQTGKRNDINLKKKVGKNQFNKWLIFRILKNVFTARNPKFMKRKQYYLKNIT